MGTRAVPLCRPCPSVVSYLRIRLTLYLTPCLSVVFDRRFRMAHMLPMSSCGIITSYLYCPYLARARPPVASYHRIRPARICVFMTHRIRRRAKRSPGRALRPVARVQGQPEAEGTRGALGGRHTKRQRPENIPNVSPAFLSLCICRYVRVLRLYLLQTRA